MAIVVGTRPEAIKMAPLIGRMSKRDDIELLVCVTGQHREMVAQVLEAFQIVPDTDLSVMRHNQQLNGLMAAIVESLDPVLDSWRPDLVMVHGDTTTTLAAALASFHRRVSVAHVEAGLRTGNLDQPFPEEMNRRVVDAVSGYLFPPTQRALENLRSEGLGNRHVTVTGNTGIDALFDMLSIMDAKGDDLSNRSGLPRLDPGRRTLLVTLHRRETLGEGLRSLCHAIRDAAHRHDLQVLFPVHLNPRVRETVFDVLKDNERVHLIDPLDYPSFVLAMRESHLILTDSGGVQEEAPSLGKPVLVARVVTERPEAVEAGTARLVGQAYDSVLANLRELLENEDAYERMARAHNPYGDGRASERIMESIGL